MKINQIWIVEFDDKARKELRKLSTDVQKKILRFLRQKIATTDDPQRFGKALSYNKKGLWRYRIGDYRVICKIEHKTVTVLILAVNHRKTIYL